MKTLTSSLLMALPLFAASGAFGQQQIFKVDPQASQVAFTLSDVLHTVKGLFHVQSGTVDFDRGAAKMSGSVVVAAGSGQSGNDTRDKKMTKDILDAPHFTDVSFVPRSYQGTLAAAGDSTIQVTGTFTLHGTPHDLTVPMEVHIDGTRCTAKTHFKVPYVQWGLKDPSNFLLKVGKDVDIDIQMVGNLTPAGA